MVIDFHTHCFTDSLAPCAVERLEKKAGIQAVHDGTLSGLAAHMAACGVDRFVVQPVATKPSQVGVINEWAQKCTDGSAVFFGALHPDDPDFTGAAQRLKESGFKGVKLHPDYQQFMTDEPRAMALYETLFREDMAVLFHAGIDLELSDPVHCTPAMLANVISAFPEATIIAGHFGGYRLWDDVEALLIGTPLYLDTAYTLPDLNPRRMVDMARRHGVDRVIFGTDSPWRDISEEVAAVSQAGFSQAELEKILWENAARILGLPVG